MRQRLVALCTAVEDGVEVQFFDDDRFDDDFDDDDREDGDFGDDEFSEFDDDLDRTSGVREEEPIGVWNINDFDVYPWVAKMYQKPDVEEDGGFDADEVRVDAPQPKPWWDRFDSIRAMRNRQRDHWRHRKGGGPNGHGDTTCNRRVDIPRYRKRELGWLRRTRISRRAARRDDCRLDDWRCED